MGTDYFEAVENMFMYRKKTIILGLTGRTGSGCSKVASILSKEDFGSLDLKQPKTYDYINAEERKQQIVYSYMKENNWKKFHIIEGSAIIISFILENGYENLIEYLKKCDSSGQCRIGNITEIEKELEKIREIFDFGIQYSLKDKRSEIDTWNADLINEYYVFYMNKLTEYKKLLYDIFAKYVCFPDKEGDGKAQLYTFLLQTWANNIRASGNPYVEDFSQTNYYDIAKRMNDVISIIQKYDISSEIRICIDAIRNTYESIYFKDNYKYYYLVSISTDDVYRRTRLSHLSKKELESLDNIENPEKFKNTEEKFYHQNIQGCVEISDIHMYNPDVENNKFYFLTEQIIKYIALILHPGLVTPTHIERCMQLAYNAKFNSGCLSRQVGAVITGDDFSIRAVGWNDVPKGQVPCNLRSVNGYCANKDCESYSQFELCDADFEDSMQRIRNKLKDRQLGGRTFSYCFKDVYNGYKGKDNQVYTRSLHAEENSFLQISKYGGAGIHGGYLFTTASPCELCAKKAYQLGITNIYYIDPYPGISMKHILSFGKTGNPKMNLFYGAIGNAYVSLYEPRMAYKDELELVTGMSVKDSVKKETKNRDENVAPIASDLRYEKMKISLEYLSAENIISHRDVDLEVTGAPINHITKEIIWTGSQYNGTSLEESEEGFEIEDSDRRVSPYKYKILFNKNYLKGEKIHYKIKTIVSDEDRQMKPYLGHMVKNPTDLLILSLKVSKGIAENVYAQEYRDSGMEIKVGDKKEVTHFEQEEYDVYEISINNPALFEIYAIRWDFKK